MFIGHFAPAMVAAAQEDAPSLPILFIAGQFVDWLFFGLLLFDIEKMRIVPGATVMNPMDLYHMPYTHSLLGGLLWAALFSGVIAMVARRRAVFAALVAGGVVLSHWFLDVLVHTQDMTLHGGPPKLGLALWDHPLVEMPLELLMTFGALWYFARKTGVSTGRVGLLAAVLALFQAINWFGPQPTGVDASNSLLAFFAFGVASLGAWWVECGRKTACKRHSEPTPLPFSRQRSDVL